MLLVLVFFFFFLVDNSNSNYSIVQEHKSREGTTITTKT